MNIPLYTLWTDTMFYAFLAAFFASLVSLIYSIRGYLELANATPYADELADVPMPYSEPAAAVAEVEELPLREPEMAEPQQEELPAQEELPPQEEPAQQVPPAQDSEKTMVVSNIEEMISQSMQAAGEAPPEEVPAPAPVELPAQADAANPAHASRAEEFVKGIYDHISRIDGRLNAIEGSISKTNGEFALKFLEDMMTDYDGLNKDKIRARIQFLISDLKK